MLPRLLRFVAAVLLVLTMSLPFAAGQSDSISIERGVKGDTAGSDKSSAPSPALPYFALMIYSLLIMTIVCMPSRKA